MNITFLGSGSFGTALAMIFSLQNYNIKVYDRDTEIINGINNLRKNIKYMKEYDIPEQVRATSDIKEAVENADIIFFSVPSDVIRDVAKKIKTYLNPKCVIISLSKGMEKGTYKRLSEVLEEELPNNSIVVLSGPSHAEEIAMKMPTTMVATSKNMESASYIRDNLSNDVLRIYTNSDIVGVELGGAMKNIIALGIGVSCGLGYGDNTNAAIITRSLHEMVRLGVQLGGKPETFFGLTGIGDLIVTCLSEHSRNRKCGILIGKGKTLDESILEVGMVVEGVNACKAFYEIAKEKNIEIPMIEALYNILFNGSDTRIIETELMMRDKKDE